LGSLPFKTSGSSGKLPPGAVCFACADWAVFAFEGVAGFFLTCCADNQVLIKSAKMQNENRLKN